MKNFDFKIDPNSRVLKFQQLIDIVTKGINAGDLRQGDPLPSVNQLIKESSLSRDTVFKAYAELRKRGLVDSIPNKGYFVARREKRILLFLDTLKAYKEVLYDEFKNNFPEKYVLDVNFHHYNIDVFESIILSGVGKYDKVIVMNFDHEKISSILGKLDSRKVCVIDWQVNVQKGQSKIYQDFGDVVFDEFKNHLQRFSTYDNFVCIYPENTYHPYEGVESFQRFCSEHQMKGTVVRNNNDVNIVKGEVYLCFEDFNLGQILEQCGEKNFEIGEDIGIISYNDTPMKKFVAGGITVLTTDFRELGRQAARFVSHDDHIDLKIDTKLICRKSF